MKRIILVVLALICGFNSFSQETQSNEVANISLPNGTKRIIGTELQTFLNKRKDSKIGPLKPGVNANTTDFYSIDEMVIKLVRAKGVAPAGYLENMKKGLDEMYKLSLPKNYFSRIKSINNYKVLLVSYDQDSLSYVHFYSLSNDYKGAINGVAEFNFSDKKKNTENFDKVLNGINFK